MKTSLAQTFNETASAAYEAFPKKLKKLVILLTPSADTPVYVSPEVANQLTKDTAAIKADVKNLANVMRFFNFVGMADKNYSLAGTPVNLIALDSKTARGLFSRRYTKAMLIIFLDRKIIIE